jgi:Asp-tRNA(Asn)/Glu-tRNA(Gln) amidotransferase B subunit
MMRTKEDAHDYRYFPDPDLLPLHVSDDWIERVKAGMPELPVGKKSPLQRTIRPVGLRRQHAHRQPRYGELLRRGREGRRRCPRPRLPPTG